MKVRNRFSLFWLEYEMSIIMPQVEKLQIKTPDQKAVISEHEPSEIEQCRKLIEGTDNIIQYIFKEIEPDATVHWGVS